MPPLSHETCIQKNQAFNYSNKAGVIHLGDSQDTIVLLSGPNRNQIIQNMLYG